MKTGSGRPQNDLTPDLSRLPEPKFLVQLEPWHRNLISFLTERNRDPLPVTSAPGEFWPDVFVGSRLPWRRFLDSAFYHLLAVVVLWGVWQLGWGRPRLAPPSTFNRADVIYYPESEYLPPLNSRPPVSYRARKGQPEYARQDIISVPSDPDNQRQTIVTPPKIKLDHDVPMPNMVAWSPTPSAIPLAATERATAEMKLPQLPTSVVAPPPDVKMDITLRSASMPEPRVVNPPPNVQMASVRQLGDIAIGHSEVVAPAPQLPMREQHQALGGSVSSAMMGSGTVVPPPPSITGTIAGTRSSQSGGQLIALSVRPAPTAPAQLPQGNRRGTFAATPQGKPGAPGTPDIPAGTGESGSGGSGNAPAGLYVGRGPNPAAVQGTGRNGDSNNRHLVASANAPRVAGTQDVREVSPEKVSTEEKRVFAGRKFYGMSLNMPNLNSSGGSWVIHFAELTDDSKKGDLSAPVAEKKVDPAYPTELMRQNVAGTVTLAAVIHSDGSVDGVHVLSSADDRLNEYARSALVRWHFRPATKNGNPVDLQAVVTIPFRPVRWKNGF
jgi:TonB family protein